MHTAPILIVIMSMLTANQPATAPARDADERYVVSGRVTGADGKPIEGVDVRAHCGIGTLRRTGETVTARDGTYRLRFRPGAWMISDDGSHRTGTQAATVFAVKSGFVEQHLCRAGNLAMSDMSDDDPDFEKSTEHYAGVVRAGQEYKNLDFVMLPAARVEGVLVDAEGKTIASKSIALDVADAALPPSSSVFASAQTGEQGRFAFDAVPTGLECWFSISEFSRHRGDINSEALTFDRAETYRFRVVRTDEDEPKLLAQRQ